MQTSTVSALARILKLPIIFEKCPFKMAQNGLKLYNLVKNGKFLVFARQKCKLPVKMTGMMGPS